MAKETNENKNTGGARYLHGRRDIVTSADAINASNVVAIVSQAYVTHLANKSDIDYLYKYYKGDQPILYREKEIRPEILNRIVENRANAIVTFRVGYTIGKPVQYVSCVSDESVSDKIATFNDLYRVAGKATKDKQLVEWQMICGTGYRLILPNEDKKAKVPFRICTPDPRQAFVIYRNDIWRTPLAGVYFTVDDNKNVHFDVYTPTEYFRIEGEQSGKLVMQDGNAMGRIPIIEYPLNMARIGAFEVVLPLLDALNNLDSNNLDSVEQTVQSLLVATNCDFDEGVTANKIRESGMVCIKSVGDSHADIKIIGESLKQTDTEILKQNLLQAINEIAGIPAQGNGYQGDSSNNGAVILKNGWQGAETKAQDFEAMFREPEQMAIEIMLDICKRLSKLNLNPDDVDVKFTRRNYEDLLAKSQTLVTMLGNDKIHPQSAYEVCGLFVDPQDAYNMGMDWFNKQQEQAPEGGGGPESEPKEGTTNDQGQTWVAGYWQKRSADTR